MKLTQFSNYALRTLMFANMHNDRFCKCQEVADAFNISKAHLIKCVHNLGQWGFLECKRGKNGGFRLAKPASEITVGSVVRKTEDTFELVECFNAETNSCPLMLECELSRALKKATANFIAELDKLSIEDITTNKSILLTMLDQHRDKSK